MPCGYFESKMSMFCYPSLYFGFLCRMEIHPGSLQSNRKIENVPSSFRSISAAQQTRKMKTCLIFSTVRKSLLGTFP